MKNHKSKRAVQHAFAFQTPKLTIKIVLLIVIFFVLFSTLFHLYIGRSPFEKNWYDSYLMQSMQWLKGKIPLESDIPHLELAIYKNNYYVSFPPTPSLFLLPFALLFGDAAPTSIITQLYSLLTLIYLFLLLKTVFSENISILLSFLILFSGSYSAIFYTGYVWHHAQTLSLLLVSASIYYMIAEKPSLSLILLALSIGARPFNILFFLPLIYLFKSIFNGKCSKIIPGFFFALLIGSSYAIYNYVRFGNIFEFGHNYLPEFSTLHSRQFAFSHISKHIKAFLFGLPVYLTPEYTLAYEQFGFSFFVALPPLFLYFTFQLGLFIKKRSNALQLITFLCFLLNVFLLLSHRTVGGFQFGARYFIDCLPYAFIFVLSINKNFVSKAMILFLVLFMTVFVPFALYGSKIFSF